VAIFESATQGTTVTSSATQVFSVTGLTSPYGVLVQNQGTVTIWVGGGTVTTTSGVPCPAGQYVYVAGPAQNTWAITASLNCPVIAGLASVAAVV